MRNLVNARATATNAVATATIAGVTGRRIAGGVVSFSYNGTPTGGRLQVLRGATVLMDLDVTGAGVGFVSLDGFATEGGEALIATLSAGGTNVVGKVNIAGEVINCGC